MKLVFPMVFLACVTPALAQEREWTIDTNGENEAFMTYGVPFTEDVGLSLWCKLGSNRVNIFVPRSGWKVGSAKQVEMKISAEPANTKVKAKLQDDDRPGSASLEAVIETASPLIKALPEAEHLDIDTGKHKVVVPLYDAPVASLIRLCNNK